MRSSYLVVGLASLLSFYALAKPAERTADAERGFSIEMPRGWEVQKDVMGAAVLAMSPQENNKDDFRENINVVVEKLDKAMSPKEYFTASQSVLKKVFNDYKLEKAGVAKIDRTDFHWTIFTHKMGAVRAKVLQYMSVNDKRAYVLTCSAAPAKFNKFKRQFETASKSFRFAAPELVNK